jgi:membrane associated rhomboid family serine protease
MLISLILLEMYGMSRRVRRVDHWSHFGGYISGLVGAQVCRYQQKQRQLLEKERKTLGLLGRIKGVRL